VGENTSKYLKLRHQPQNVNEKHKSTLGLQEKLALYSTNIVGTMYAVYFFIIALCGWMLWQTFIDKHPFDPYPFAFLLFLGNIVQLLMLPLIMVGQKVQSRHAEIRADEEYETTQTSYRDIEQILLHLNAQDVEMKKQLEILLKLSGNAK